ncbi:hypothetical protein TNIN_98331 [Trichonephila inaurata madagascariensis]|uniref:Uncharacterized protein n=1 Tax=Trichonephila inaurata madagascariensis TaxID=2747483 RepID=A0A8X6Y1Q5_9ARAC|nr:hypothetical protein TNIN_98331 [Trichonephila inaurata madagascariensis]
MRANRNSSITPDPASITEESGKLSSPKSGIAWRWWRARRRRQRRYVLTLFLDKYCDSVIIVTLKKPSFCNGNITVFPWEKHFNKVAKAAIKTSRRRTLSYLISACRKRKSKSTRSLLKKTCAYHFLCGGRKREPFEANGRGREACKALKGEGDPMRNWVVKSGLRVGGSLARLYQLRARHAGTKGPTHTTSALFRGFAEKL